MKQIPRKLKLDWQSRENHELSEERRRRYLHFDPKIERVTNHVLKNVTATHFVQTHSFFPLLKRVQKTRLYKRDPQTKKKIITQKERPISYAAHIDALIYSWYATLLESHYETVLAENKLTESVIAYRKLGKSNIELAAEVFEHILNTNRSTAICFDVKGFYDSLDHSQLKKEWARILNEKNLPLDHYKVFRSLTKYSFVLFEDVKTQLSLSNDTENFMKSRLFLGLDVLEDLRTSEKIHTHQDSFGIPQGTPISCVLSNIYMLEFDKEIAAKVESVGGLYRRYSDDIIVVCPEDSYLTLKDAVMDAIRQRLLEIQDSKTETRHFRETNHTLTSFDENGKPLPLQYLGILFDGERLGLRHKGYAKFERNMTKAIRGEVRTALRKKVAVAKRKLYEKFTPLGEANYVSYAQRAAKLLDSNEILRPVRKHLLMRKLNRKISSTERGVSDVPRNEEQDNPHSNA